MTAAVNASVAPHDAHQGNNRGNRGRTYSNAGHDQQYSRNGDWDHNNRNVRYQERRGGEWDGTFRD